jgi:16S rRNA (guanine966-N2)-methyltransferase
MMRIVAGRHRGRAIAAPAGRKVRPTSDRVRESVFNIIIHGLGGAAPPIDDVRVLDGFAGTGAMGLEALSRGADHAVFMDLDIGPCQTNVDALGEAARSEIIRADCLRPPPAPSPTSLIFIDPPYGENCAAAALIALDEAGWIGAGAVCVVETDPHEEIGLLSNSTWLDDRQIGAARIRIMRRDG